KNCILDLSLIEGPGELCDFAGEIRFLFFIAPSPVLSQAEGMPTTPESKYETRNPTSNLTNQTIVGKSSQSTPESREARPKLRRSLLATEEHRDIAFSLSEYCAGIPVWPIVAKPVR